MPKPRDTKAEHARRYSKKYVLKFEIDRAKWEELSEEKQQDIKRKVRDLIKGELENGSKV